MSVKVLDCNDVLAEKYARRQQIPQIRNDVHGHCTHIGDISYACRQCFANLQGGGIQIGQECNVDCPMCYYDRNRRDGDLGKQVAQHLGDFYQMASDPNTRIPYAYSYQSAGETLMYIDEIEKFADIFKKIEKERDCHIYHHLYTNGILADYKMLKRLKDMEVDEIRFHVSASNWSKKVKQNMMTAAEMNFIVTVEEPAWPSNRQDLFDHLDFFQELDLRHLDIVEVQVTPHNLPFIEKECNKHEGIGIYKDALWQMYDGGLVYDIMEEALKRGHTYSMLDCNSAVERCRQLKGHATFDDINFYNDGFRDYHGFNARTENKWRKVIKEEDADE